MNGPGTPSARRSSDPFVDATGSVRLAFHAWATDAKEHPVRALWIGTLAFAP